MGSMGYGGYRRGIKRFGGQGLSITLIALLQTRRRNCRRTGFTDPLNEGNKLETTRGWGVGGNQIGTDGNSSNTKFQ